IVLNNRTTRWIPVSLDKSVFEYEFYVKAMTDIEKMHDEMSTLMIEALQKKMDITPLQDEMSRLKNLKANLGNTIAELKRVLIVDIAGISFEPGMKKVLESMKNE
ncbi:MAG: hypothetical protein ACKOCH_22090, partial [Bacteroidota bacterium]